jgi:hypothetical protein
MSDGQWDWCRDCGGRITMGDDGWYHGDNRIYATVPHVPEPHKGMT